ncbi:hypothetical protein PIB30_081855 [Stylosanthes scabra]|uniref:Seed biotin-containing protein SBP65 n=1 Tax=Stylosanthes scabra TaxID=79078 RepID=A0ABU6QRE6_9FABA|nr:hypothetical protein [Stylosanthes scabra]
MASEQLQRRENTTAEREVHIEKDRVVKMTTHFEHLAEEVKESDDSSKEIPQGSIAALQGGEVNKDHAGKAIGDIGGRGKARETHELGATHGHTHGHNSHGAQFESLADKVEGSGGGEHGARRSENVVASGAMRGGAHAQAQAQAQHHNVGKLERSREELEGRTREVKGSVQQRSGQNKESVGQVTAEKARREEPGATQGQRFQGARVGAAAAETTQGAKAKSNQEQQRFQGGGGRVGGVSEREAAKTSKNHDQERFQGGGRVGGGVSETAGAKATKNQEQERFQGGGRVGGVSEREAATTTKNHEQERFQGGGRVGGGGGGDKEAPTAAVITCTFERGRDKPEEGETLGSTARTAQQQSYAASTKETLTNAAKTAAEYTAPVADKAKDYTLQAAEKAKSTGGTTAHYVGEKAVQAKDVTLESGKTAAEYAGKAAVDLKDKAAAAAWKAANFGTEVTVEGTKAAVHVVEGAAGYAGHKAAELAAKSVGVVKGLAASAGETAKEYTARKKEEAQRDLQVKKSSQFQEERPTQGVAETVSQTAEKVAPRGHEGTGSSVLSSIGETVGNVGQQIRKPFENLTVSGRTEESNRVQRGQHKGGEAMTRVGETIGDVAQRVKQPLDSITGNITEGGGEVLGAVGETVGEIGESMIKPAERAQEEHDGREGLQGGGVLGAIGETISEIAHTTKALVVGEEGSETMQKNVEERRRKNL